MMDVAPPPTSGHRTSIKMQLRRKSRRVEERPKLMMSEVCRDGSEGSSLDCTSNASMADLTTTSSSTRGKAQQQEQQQEHHYQEIGEEDVLVDHQRRRQSDGGSSISGFGNDRTNASDRNHNGDNQEESARPLTTQPTAEPSHPVAFGTSTKATTSPTPEQPSQPQAPSKWTSSRTSRILYDREEQYQLLQQAYARRTRPLSYHQQRQEEGVADEEGELVLITGPSGTGKTVLALSLRDRVEQDGGFFISGKFDQRQHSQWYSAIADAFAQFVTLVLKSDDHTIAYFQRKILQAVESEAQLLVDTLPCLGKLLQIRPTDLDNDTSSLASSCRLDGSASSMLTASDNRKHFASVFQKFVRVIASPKHPLVLLLDDVQWADLGSLDLLDIIVRSLNPNSTSDNGENIGCNGLMVLCTCRGNEVSFGDALSVLLRKMEDGDTARIFEIQVPNLRPEALCQWLADYLELPYEKCIQLASIVLSQTDGNPFFAMQYVRSLQQDGLLFKDPATGACAWDEAAIIRNSVGDDCLLDLLASKIQQMTPEIQHVLKVAACLGGEFDIEILGLAALVSQDQCVDALTVARDWGFVACSETDARVCRFSHDKMQETAYTLIPEEHRPKFHLQIAKNLVAGLDGSAFEENLILVVNHAIIGASEIETYEVRLQLASQCLNAGRMAARSSAFSVAMFYLDAGIAQLQHDRRHWRDEYDISLALFSSAAEVAYCTGDHKKVDELSDAINRNARCFEDKLSAMSTLIMSSSVSGDHSRAVKLGFEAARKLGERLPYKLGMLGMMMEFVKAKRAVGRKTARHIMAMPPMSNQRALRVMSIIHLLYSILIVYKMELSPIVAFRMIRLTMKYGLCPLSSLAFGIYASVLSRMGFADESFAYGQLALDILEAYRSKELASRVLCVVWGDAMPNKKPLRMSLEPQILSHRLGLITGDVTNALTAGFVHDVMSFYVGDPLNSIIELANHHRTICKEHQHPFIDDFIGPLLQACLNLQGLAYRDPLILDGDAMLEKELVDKASSEKLATGFVWIYMAKYFLSTFLHEFDYAESLSTEIRKHMGVIVVPFMKPYHIWCEGIVAAANAKDSRSRRAKAKKRLKQLKKLAVNCPENLVSKIYLLEGELASCSEKYDEALDLYDLSIAHASKEGYEHEKGLACEKAALMLRGCGNLEQARVYFEKARAAYVKWGANLKVDDIDRILSNDV